MPTNSTTLHIVGSASGIAAPYADCGNGPLLLKESSYFNETLAKHHIKYQWDAMLQPPKTHTDVLAAVTDHCEKLATTVASLVHDKKSFVVFGGDHSCAIGTWSGVYSELKQYGDLGLIWIDAHMDSHTPATSETGNIHGMPLACLLGHGFPPLTSLLGAGPKLKPEHLCLIGIRSFESGEAELLKRLKVRIYYMDEVKQRGLEVIMQEAIALVTKGTAAFGVTLDIDSIDPVEAPGTGVSEPDGLSANELKNVLTMVHGDPRLIGIEIVEFDPNRDKEAMTEKLTTQLLISMLAGKSE